MGSGAGGASRVAGVDSPLLFYVPEADAVVSTGSRDRWLELPEAQRLVGPYDNSQLPWRAGGAGRRKTNL